MPLKVSKIRSPQGAADRGVDIVAEIETSKGKRQTIMIEIKSVGYPSNIRQAVRQLKTYAGGRGYPVFASPFIGTQGRDLCREEGVGYLDLAGNILLDLPGAYIEKAVEANPFSKPGRPKSLFSPVSARVTRAFLEEPGRAWKVIELAQTMGMSLGQTSKVARQLTEAGYLTKDKSGLRVKEPGKLLDDWRDQYQPAGNRRAAFYSFEKNPERLMKDIAAKGKKENLEYAVTSFAAALMVAPFIRGISAVQWYAAPDQADQWVKALDLRPVEAGANAFMVTPYDKSVFYRSQAVNGVKLVSNLQLYLDLYGDPARGREQAEFLRQEKLKI